MAGNVHDSWFRFLCPTCGKRLKAASSWAGRKARCISCGQALLVPGLTVAPWAGGTQATPPRPAPPNPWGAGWPAPAEGLDVQDLGLDADILSPPREDGDKPKSSEPRNKVVESLLGAVHALPPLHAPKSPTGSAVLGFCCGGIGLGFYWLSFIDFVMLLFVTLLSLLPVILKWTHDPALAFLGQLLGALFASIYGYFRALTSNAKLNPATPRLSRWKTAGLVVPGILIALTLQILLMVAMEKGGGPSSGVLASGEGTSEWKDLASREGRFRVRLPAGKPVQTTQNVDSAAGQLTIHTLGVEAINGSRFIITYNDLPPEAMKEGAEPLLEGTRIGLTNSVPGAKVVKDTKITVEGNPGRAFTVDLADRRTMYVRAFIVKERLYQLFAAGSEGQFDERAANTFFDSFHLTG
jgi:hypothetical protein